MVGIHYRAHDGSLRPAWLLVPVDYNGERPLPLVISPHGRGVGAVANMRIWGDIPIQLYWSTQDRIISDQRLETQRLALSIRHDDDDARLRDFTGARQHTAEMRASRRLPRALARFGLLPWRDVPRLQPAVRPARVLGA
jgi:hypothetical protein